jgi:hypothetical protein
VHDGTLVVLVEQCGVTVHLAESREAVAIYNKLAECTLVAGLASATVIATDGPSDWYPVHTSGRLPLSGRASCRGTGRADHPDLHDRQPL